jgi:arylformamidase
MNAPNDGVSSSVTTFDITLPLSDDHCVWPGDPRVEIRPDGRISAGDSVNTSLISMETHTGTHVDTPWHVDDDGQKLGEIAPDRWCGECYVAEFPAGVVRIEPHHLETAAIPPGTTRLLLKTANSRLWDRPRPWVFEKSYVALSPEAASWMVPRGIELVGIDYLSIEAYEEPGNLTHHILLSNRVLILEGLDLRQVNAGSYLLTCLPMRIERGDGAPARAILTTMP